MSALPIDDTSESDAPAYTIEIESDVPVPARTRLNSDERYPWLDLKIDQSFFVPEKFEKHDDTAARLKNRMQGRATTIMERNKAAKAYFVVRAVDEAGRGVGVRVWRKKLPESPKPVTATATRG